MDGPNVAEFWLDRLHNRRPSGRIDRHAGHAMTVEHRARRRIPPSGKAVADPRQQILRTCIAHLAGKIRSDTPHQLRRATPLYVASRRAARFHHRPSQTPCVRDGLTTIGDDLLDRATAKGMAWTS